MRALWIVALMGLAACGTRMPCDESNCSAGCCDTLGRCQSGVSRTQCGNSGASCRSCSATETCSSSGVCVPGMVGTGGGSAGGGAAGGNVGGSGGACTTDANCVASETCHPLLGRCVPGCATTSDCPSSARTCSTFNGMPPGTAGQRGLCQCATDALCSAATPGTVCQPVTKICQGVCPATPCPAGLTCDTATGKCTSGAPDGGVGGPCVPGSCTQGVCDPTTQRCVTAPSCSLAAPQPDSCVYGLFCRTAACAEAPFTGKGCSNFSTVATPLAWDPATVTPKGPVTHAFTARATNDDTFCSGANPNAFTYVSDLYAAPSSTFPSMIDLAQGLTYVRTDGQQVSLSMGAVRPQSGYAMGLSNNNKNLRLVWTVCGPSSVTTLQAGFFAENGNPNCATQMR